MLVCCVVLDAKVPDHKEKIKFRNRLQVMNTIIGVQYSLQTQV